MENVRLSLYEKNMKTGILENFLGSYHIEENIELIDKAYVVKEENDLVVYLFLTVDREIEDWEYGAIYDYYDGETLEESGIVIEEVEDCYNPTWFVCFGFLSSQEEMEKKLNHILMLHKNELQEVYEIIKDKQQEYEEE